MNKLIPLSLAIASVLTFPAIAQAQSFSLNDGGTQHSNYIRLVSEEQVSETRVSDTRISENHPGNHIQIEQSVRSHHTSFDPAKRVVSYPHHSHQTTGHVVQKTMYTASSLPSSSLPSSSLPSSSLPSSSLQRVTESGSRPSHVASAGWAKDMPLSLAVRQVIPSDFSVNENGVPLSQLVSWSGDLSWPVVLDELSRHGNFISHIDWNKKEVSLAPAFVSRQSLSARPTQEPVEKPMVVADTSRKDSTSISTGVYSKDDASTLSTRVIRSTDVVSTQTTVVSSHHSWTLDPKMTLRQNIEKWAEKVGWHVVWEASDYPIIAPASFTGEFASPTGPLARLIAAYERSDQPLVAKLTTMDKVVYVRNKYYENTEVVPTSSSELSSELFQDIKN